MKHRTTPDLSRLNNPCYYEFSTPTADSVSPLVSHSRKGLMSGQGKRSGGLVSRLRGILTGSRS